MDRTWTQELLEQLTWHWDNHLRPRLATLSDDEYLWEPTPGSWTIRPRTETNTPLAAGAEDLVIDWDYPPPTPPPLTTIAWRLGHVTVGVFATRSAAHFN